MNRSQTRTAKKVNHPGNAAWKAEFLALVISFCIGALLILVASLIANLTADPGRWIRPLAIFAAALTYLFSGMVAARMRQDAPLASGAIIGLLLSACLLILSLFFRKSVPVLPTYAIVLLHAGTILLSLLGAYLVVWKQRKPKRKKHKHR